MVDVFVPRLFVVVPFPPNRLRFNVFTSFSRALHFRHPIHYETPLVPFISRRFLLLATLSLCSGYFSTRRSFRNAFRLRRKTSYPLYSQQRQNHGPLLSRRAAQIRGPVRTQKTRHHYRRRSAPRRSCKNPLGTPAGRISRHALRQYSRRWLGPSHQ